MEKMKSFYNFDDLSLEELESVQDSLKTAIRKKYKERKEKAFSEFVHAYAKFRELSSEEEMYVEVYCDGCEDNIDVDLGNLLDKYFGL